VKGWRTSREEACRNVPRIFRKDQSRPREGLLAATRVFEWLQREGKIAEGEMHACSIAASAWRSWRREGRRCGNPASFNAGETVFRIGRIEAAQRRRPQAAVA